MSPRVAVFFNTNKLGGAERSMLALLHETKSKYALNFKIFYPLLDGALDLKLDTFKESSSFSYPKELYHLSRSGRVGLSTCLKIFRQLLKFFRDLQSLNLNSFNEIWLNGNKVAYPILLFLSLRNLISSNKFNGRILWFWRDYPINHFVLRYLYLIFDSQLNLLSVANSKDVAKSVKQCFAVAEVKVIYPLPDHPFESREITEVKTVGVPAMLTKWKGLYEVLVMVKSYEQELRELGITKFLFFGEQIYQTEGEHEDYKKKLLSYVSDHQLKLVSFEGKQSPETIMAQSDLIIHSTLSAEPFGRVVIEAFMAKVPVVSTALGGASEMVRNEVSGLSYGPYSAEELFLAIKRIVLDKRLRQSIQQEAYKKYLAIKNYNQEVLERLFS